ncbi:MAG: nucleoside transporter C-terminal domain-containing protein [Zavarzinella sp.]
MFQPAALMMGVPLEDAPRVAELLGKKLVLNEFISFDSLTTLNRDAATGAITGMSERSYLLTTFALTGFANFSSIGIVLGGIGGLAPSRRKDLARLSLRALYGGFLATLINASIAGIVL